MEKSNVLIAVKLRIEKIILTEKTRGTLSATKLIVDPFVLQNQRSHVVGKMENVEWEHKD